MYILSELELGNSKEMVEIESEGDLALSEGVLGVRYFLIDLSFGLEDGFR